MDPYERLDSQHYEHRAFIRDFERRPEQRFDRVAFAMKVLCLLRIPHTCVAVFSSCRLVVESGRELGSMPDSRWAMVGIPADDARGLHVAWAAAELMERAH